MNESSDSRPPCLVPDLRGKALSFSRECDASCGLAVRSLFTTRGVLSIPTVLWLSILNGSGILPSVFPASVETIA